MRLYEFINEQPKQLGALDYLKVFLNLVKTGGQRIIDKFVQMIKGTPPQENVNEQTITMSNISDIAGNFAKKNPLKFMQVVKQIVDQERQTIVAAINGVSAKFNQEIGAFFNKLADINSLSEFSSQDIKNAIEWFTSGPLQESDFNQTENTTTNVINLLSAKNKKYTQILVSENIISDIAKSKVYGDARGEGFLAIVFGGKISGGTKGAKGDVTLFKNKSYEVKANGRKTTGEKSPIVFAGRGELNDNIKTAGDYMMEKFEEFGQSVSLDKKGKMTTTSRAESLNSFGVPRFVEMINSLDKKTAIEFLNQIILKTFGGQTADSKALVKQSVAKGYDAKLFRKAFILENARFYLEAKDFDGLVFFNFHELSKDNVPMRTFSKKTFVDSVKKGDIFALRTESINSMISGDVQSALPGIAFK